MSAKAEAAPELLLLLLLPAVAVPEVDLEDGTQAEEEAEPDLRPDPAFSAPEIGSSFFGVLLECCAERSSGECRCFAEILYKSPRARDRVNTHAHRIG